MELFSSSPDVQKLNKYHNKKVFLHAVTFELRKWMILFVVLEGKFGVHFQMHDPIFQWCMIHICNIITCHQ